MSAAIPATPAPGVDHTTPCLRNTVARWLFRPQAELAIEDLGHDVIGSFAPGTLDLGVVGGRKLSGWLGHG